MYSKYDILTFMKDTHAFLHMEFAVFQPGLISKSLPLRNCSEMNKLARLAISLNFQAQLLRLHIATKNRIREREKSSTVARSSKMRFL